MSKTLISVPYIDQSVKYPTGCESVSTVMLLQFLGVSITVDEFIENDLKKEAFETRNGELFGPDPRECFVGSPYDDESFGCYAPVIKESLEHVLGEEYRVLNKTGTDTKELIRDYIDRGMPVIYWACINMREPIVGPEWKLKKTGETFTWISNEHCMLLVGYDKENYYFNDPYENHGVIGYPKAVVEKRYTAQHMQAVVVEKR